MRRSRWVMLAVVPVLVVGGAAAAYAVGHGQSTRIPRAQVLDDVVCPVPEVVTAADGVGDPAITPGSQPGGFAPVAVVECPRTLRAGVDPATEEVRHEGDLDPFLAALAARDDRTWAWGAVNCTASYETLPWLWLVDAGGRAALMHVPQDACHDEKPAARRALAQIPVVHGS